MSISKITHISSMKDICRCCHSIGKFKSLKEPCIVRGKVEVYYQMIIETFGILINPQIKEASYTICDECIVRLRDSTTFRNQVEACEEKFNQYSQLFYNPVDTKIRFRNHNYIENKTLYVDIEVENVDSELKIKNDSLVYVEDKLNNNDEVLDVDHKEEELDTVQYKVKNVNETDDIGDEVKNLYEDFIESKNTVDHYKTHLTRNKNEKKKHKCNDCGCLFVCLTSLKVHSRTIHNKLLSLDEYKNADKVKNGFQNAKFSNYLKCRFCDKKVPEYYYERHLKTHVGKTECINCGIIFESTDHLKEHSKKHKYENMHTCDICKKRFIGKSTLKRHIDLHHMGKGRKFMCHECGVFFNDITNLRSHTTTVHMKLRMFECSVCQKKLASKKTLKVHMRTHTGERPYVCEECGDGFICFTKLKIHKIKHDVMKKYGAKYVCKICHSTFHGQGLLTHHVRSEHPGCLPITINKRKYLPCPSCNKVFSQKYSFDRHMTKHGVIDKVPCKICNKMLIDKFSLYRHIRNIHASKEKVIKEKVQCSLCKRKVQDIENHMKVHTVRPMKCETCGKNYPDEVTLHRHVMNVHHDVNKIFQCKKCDRRPYSRRENLRSHVLKKHGCDLNVE